jgi:hypothetical protein
MANLVTWILAFVFGAVGGWALSGSGCSARSWAASSAPRSASISGGSSPVTTEPDRALLLLLVLLAPAIARAEVRTIETGGFGLDRNVTVAGTPVQVYDMITGDLRPWWDHTFSEHPKAFLHRALAGRRLHRARSTTRAMASSTPRCCGPSAASACASRPARPHRQRGRVRLHLRPRGAGSRQHEDPLHRELRGKVEKGWAEGVDQVWGHFLEERLRAYAGTPAARSRKPWPRPKSF